MDCGGGPWPVRLESPERSALFTEEQLVVSGQQGRLHGSEMSPEVGQFCHRARGGAGMSGSLVIVSQRCEQSPNGKIPIRLAHRVGGGCGEDAIPYRWFQDGSIPQ